MCDQSIQCCLSEVHIVISVTPTGEITSASDPMFILKCTTTGAPAVVTWSYSGTSRMYTNDGRHRLSQSLLNRVTSTFESRLEFLSHPYPSDTGERVCIATATYISANSSETNPSTAVGKSTLIYNPSCATCIKFCR